MLVLSEKIESYRPAVEAILSWMPDWISQHEFDALVTSTGIMGRAWFMDEHTISLGNGTGDLAQAIDLLHRMARLGLVADKIGEDGVVYYKSQHNA
jgi:hypothetical protein